MLGIVNGTTNFMLTKMDEEGVEYADVFAEAEALGYLESDPSLDVDGHDAAAKAAILAELAFHTRVTLEDVHCEGISGVHVWRTSGRPSRWGSSSSCSPSPSAPTRASSCGSTRRCCRDHPLASVRGAFNAVFVEAEAAGEVMFYGRGAGGAPTASAVLGDVVTAARTASAAGLGRGRAPTRTCRRCPSGRH